MLARLLAYNVMLLASTTARTQLPPRTEATAGFVASSGEGKLEEDDIKPRSITAHATDFRYAATTGEISGRRL